MERTCVASGKCFHTSDVSNVANSSMSALVILRVVRIHSLCTAVRKDILALPRLTGYDFFADKIASRVKLAYLVRLVLICGAKSEDVKPWR